MTARIEKTVFISYRRTNFWTALAVFKELHSNGYDVFFDYKSIPSGDFEQAITENITSRAHFIVILSPSALERCHEPGDWLRREIETAIENKRNIIPLMMEGFDFGSPATIKALTGKLADLKKYNAMGIPAEYFEDAMTKLRGERFLNRPLEYVSHSVSDVSKQVTDEQKSAAIEASPVETSQLTAEEWFERGYVYAVEVKNFDEAIRCFSEAISLKPDFAAAYNNRGMAYGEKGDLDLSIADLDEAIRPDPEDSDAYNNRGSMRGEKGDFQNATADYKEATRLDPSNADAYYNLGLIYGRDIGNFDDGILNFNEAIRLQPDNASAYTNRGNARFVKGDLDGAYADFDEAINLEPEHTNAYYGRASILEQQEDAVSAIADYQKFLELGNDIQDELRKDVEKRIKKLKNKLVKKKSQKRQTK